MKILHIIPEFNRVIVTNYVQFIRQNFNKDQHSFCIISSSSEKKMVNINGEKIPSVNKIIIKDIKKIFLNYDKVILHYNQLDYRIKIFLILNQRYLTKLYWVAWGADLYFPLTNNILPLKSKIIEFINIKFLQFIKHFIAIFPPDILFFKERYNKISEYYFAPYIINFNIVKSNIIHVNSDSINILVGHSSSRELNHIKSLKFLSKFKNQNIKIFIPLSYGEKEYALEVKEYATEIFGEKAIILEKFMDNENYNFLLSKIDIAVFNTDRQIGLGNIIPLLSAGKKIYLKKNSVMYNYFRSLNINVKEIDFNITFSQFIEINNNNKKRSINYIKKTYNNKEFIYTQWKNIFEN